MYVSVLTNDRQLIAKHHELENLSVAELALLDFKVDRISVTEKGIVGPYTLQLGMDFDELKTKLPPYDEFHLPYSANWYFEYEYRFTCPGHELISEKGFSHLITVFTEGGKVAHYSEWLYREQGNMIVKLKQSVNADGFSCSIE